MADTEIFILGAIMSSSIVKRTVLATAGVWVVLILIVAAQSLLGVSIGGVQPEASRLILMMALPFTVGLSAIAIGAAFFTTWWRKRHNHSASHTVLRTALVTASVWAVLLLFIIIQSALNVRVAGVYPEASRLILMMTLPFTVGLSVIAMAVAFFMTWWRGRHSQMAREHA